MDLKTLSTDWFHSFRNELISSIKEPWFAVIICSKLDLRFSNVSLLAGPRTANRESRNDYQYKNHEPRLELRKIENHEPQNDDI